MAKGFLWTLVIITAFGMEESQLSKELKTEELTETKDLPKKSAPSLIEAAIIKVVQGLQAHKISDNDVLNYPNIDDKARNLIIELAKYNNSKNFNEQFGVFFNEKIKNIASLVKAETQDVENIKKHISLIHDVIVLLPKSTEDYLQTSFSKLLPELVDLYRYKNNQPTVEKDFLLLINSFVNHFEKLMPQTVNSLFSDLLSDIYSQSNLAQNLPQKQAKIKLEIAALQLIFTINMYHNFLEGNDLSVGEPSIKKKAFFNLEIIPTFLDAAIALHDLSLARLVIDYYKTYKTADVFSTILRQAYILNRRFIKHNLLQLNARASSLLLTNHLMMNLEILKFYQNPEELELVQKITEAGVAKKNDVVAKLVKDYTEWLIKQGD